MHGEKASADSGVAEDFQQEFPSFISGYSLDQIFNCDETGLYYRCLPDKTLASAFEKRAEGRKKAKDHVTANACANLTGSIKLPLLFIGKSKRPRCFKNTYMDSLPVIYRNQKNVWVNTEIFSSRFHDQFVPYVQRELKSKSLPPKALLTLDNCSAHPEEDVLVSDDGLVIVKFFPLNVTSLLIQPMNQGVLESMKRRYKRSLLQDVLLSEDLIDSTTLPSPLQ
ncbi:tigger transposable element-derived protein 2-like [Dysidea avara]|uniref:tigger transposable element-derived protein 2-like n=1 Tax=Dysidea avara TaxID=196820 RepID=UPI0033324E94